MLTPRQQAEIEAAARPMLRRTMRRGLIVGFALGVVAALIVFAMVVG